MTLNTACKDWFATNAGTGTCFVGSGKTYSDADGISHTGRTGDVANAFYTAHQVGKDGVVIIASTTYTQLRTINGGIDFDLSDVGWVYANDGGTGSTGTYCKSTQTCTALSSCSITICPTSSINQGSQGSLTVSWVGGTPSYSIQLLRDGSAFGSATTVSSTSANINFNVDTSWSAGTHTVSVRVTDSCSTGAQSCTSSTCTLNVVSPSSCTNPVLQINIL